MWRLWRGAEYIEEARLKLGVEVTKRIVKATRSEARVNADTYEEGTGCSTDKDKHVIYHSVLHGSVLCIPCVSKSFPLHQSCAHDFILSCAWSGAWQLCSALCLSDLVMSCASPVCAIRCMAAPQRFVCQRLDLVRCIPCVCHQVHGSSTALCLPVVVLSCAFLVCLSLVLCIPGVPEPCPVPLLSASNPPLSCASLACLSLVLCTPCVPEPCPAHPLCVPSGVRQLCSAGGGRPLDP